MIYKKGFYCRSFMHYNLTHWICCSFKYCHVYSDHWKGSSKFITTQIIVFMIKETFTKNNAKNIVEYTTKRHKHKTGFHISQLFPQSIPCVVHRNTRRAWVYTCKKCIHTTDVQPYARQGVDSAQVTLHSPVLVWQKTTWQEDTVSGGSEMWLFAILYKCQDKCRLNYWSGAKQSDCTSQRTSLHTAGFPQFVLNQYL